MPNNDNSKVAFVTGALAGIGLETAALFAKRGYRVALTGRDSSRGSAAEAQLRTAGLECTFIFCDVTADDSVKQAIDLTLGRYGRLDAAFNCAGVNGGVGVLTADTSLQTWDRTIATNLTGVWYCMRHQIPAMLANGGGSIVNCSSVAGLVGSPTYGAYGASKHGVVGLTKSAALEYAKQHVRINAICPGMINTAMTRENPEKFEEAVARSSMGRLGSAFEIADAVLWLCGEGAGFVTGQAIAVDGALTSR